MNKKQYETFLKKHKKFKDMLMTWEQYKERKATLKRDVESFRASRGLR